MVEIKGFIDISLSDWEGKVSSVIFLPRCNFRCPFCYNKDLVLHPDIMPTIAMEQIEQYLETNRKWIDGIVITGGEPTQHNDLPDLCYRLKKMHFNIKLDTNGTNPTMARNLVNNQLIDHLALDVKAPLTKEEYSLATGTDATEVIERILETVHLLIETHFSHEFRTTLVPSLHTQETVEKICNAIKGCRKYVLQNLKPDVETIDPRFQCLQPFSLPQMEAFLRTARRIVPDTYLRG